MLGGGILGAIFGSFIGALCCRWPKGQSVISPRSHCETCDRALGTDELIPLFSFLWQKGRCKGCNEAIDPVQFVAELAAAVIGITGFGLMDPLSALSFAIMGWLLLPLILLDYRHYWLPDRLIITLAIAAPITGHLLIPQYDWTLQLLAGFIIFAVFEVLRNVYKRIRDKEGMGSGDPKLVAAIALWIPALTLPYLLLIASLSGLLYVILFTDKSKRQDQKLPFGSFLGVAALVVQFTNLIFQMA